MAKSEKLEHIHRRLTDEERRLAVTIREGAEQRAIEQGEDVPLLQFRAVAAALGLSIELVEQVQ